MAALDVCSEVSTGSAVSFATPEMGVKVLSSMIVTFFFGSEGRNDSGRTLIAQPPAPREWENSLPCLAWESPVFSNVV